jgi:acetyl esterase/lipase
MKRIGQAFAIVVCLLSGLVNGPDAAAQQQRQLAYRIPGMDQVRRIADLSYRSLVGTADTVMYGTDLRYDVFMPGQQTQGTRAGVVFVHGGLVPDTVLVSPKDDLPAYREWGRLVAAAGMVGITFSHRLTTADNLDVAAQDLEALLRVVRARAAEWALDPDRLCVAVYSAGGPLGSLFFERRDRNIRCIVMFYPFLDVEHTAALSSFRRAHPHARVEELRRYSPRELLLRLGGDVPPLLVAKGGRDAIPGINASIDRFVQAALWVNAPLDLHVHRTGSHGFDMTTGSDPRAQEIVAAALAFIRRHTQ